MNIAGAHLYPSAFAVSIKDQIRITRWGERPEKLIALAEQVCSSYQLVQCPYAAG